MPTQHMRCELTMWAENPSGLGWKRVRRSSERLVLRSLYDQWQSEVV